MLINDECLWLVLLVGLVTFAMMERPIMLTFWEADKLKKPNLCSLMDNFFSVGFCILNISS